jgi:hypothetical protein
MSVKGAISAPKYAACQSAPSAVEQPRACGAQTSPALIDTGRRAEFNGLPAIFRAFLSVAVAAWGSIAFAF